MILNGPIVFLDTETTGLNVDIHEVWEIGAIRVEPTGKKSTFWAMITDINLHGADKTALEINHFWETHPVGVEQSSGPTNYIEADLFMSKESVASELATFLHDATIIGSNPDFDVRFIDKLFRQTGNYMSHKYHCIDIKSMVMGYLSGIGIAFPVPAKTQDLYHKLGIAPQDADTLHTAMGDAETVQAVWDYLIANNK